MANSIDRRLLMDWMLWLTIARWVIRITMIPVVLRRRLPATTAIAWLAAIFLFPILGLAIYLLIGSPLLGTRRRRRYRRIVQSDAFGGSHDLPRADCNEANTPVRDHTERVFGMPATPGNAVHVITEHDEFISALIESFDAATSHIHVMTYIFQPDETGRSVADALQRAAERGVRCRLLADAAGSRQLFKCKQLVSQMLDRGVELRMALPVSLWRVPMARMDLRNHRKIAIIDGTTGYTGSHNIINFLYPVSPPLPCFDLSLRFNGPVVTQLQRVFCEDWHFETDERLNGPSIFPELPQVGTTAVQTVPTGPEHEGRTMQRVLLTAINGAQRQLIVTTPYFAPGEHIMMALILAVERGVEVHIVGSKRSDYAVVAAAGRSFFTRLMKHGVHVHLFQDGILHAKTMTVDDHLAWIGSANVDVRSLVLNFEFNSLLYGREITSRLREAQLCYMQRSVEMDLERWEARPILRRYLDDAAALLAPLL